MRKLSFFIVALVAVAFIAGCEDDSLISKIGMDTDEAVEKVAEVYKNNVDTGSYRPINIMWCEAEEVPNALGYISMDMIGRDGKVYVRLFELYDNRLMPKGIKESDNKRIYDFGSVEWLLPEDIDFQLIKTHYDAAKACIPEEGVYKFKAIDDYVINVSPETGKRTYYFTMSAIEKTKRFSIKRGRLEPEYYDVKYEGFADGTVKQVD